VKIPSTAELAYLIGGHLGGLAGNVVYRSDGSDSGFRLSSETCHRLVYHYGEETGLFLGGRSGNELVNQDGGSTGIFFGRRYGPIVRLLLR